MQLRSRQMPRDQLCRLEGTASNSTLTNLLPLLLRIWILLYSRFKLLSACIQIGSTEIRVSRFLYTSFWAETRCRHLPRAKLHQLLRSWWRCRDFEANRFVWIQTYSLIWGDENTNADWELGIRWRIRFGWILHSTVDNLADLWSYPFYIISPLTTY